jgi:hypothetical protein
MFRSQRSRDFPFGENACVSLEALSWRTFWAMNTITAGPVKYLMHICAYNGEVG